jgi:hypothetical protein
VLAVTTNLDVVPAAGRIIIPNFYTDFAKPDEINFKKVDKPTQ